MSFRRRVFNSDVVLGASKKEPIIASQSIMSEEAAVAQNAEWKSSLSFVGLLGVCNFRMSYPGYMKYQNLLYSAAMTVPSKAVELYLDLRRLVEDCVRVLCEPTADKLLPDLHPADQHVFTLVLVVTCLENNSHSSKHFEDTPQASHIHLWVQIINENREQILPNTFPSSRKSPLTVVSVFLSPALSITIVKGASLSSFLSPLGLT
ncbi:hypothetical protein Ddye_027978 [Dipteronia dyeriana]|uniref:Uncharacterized protein n=1 Tax=Dipteronia dyeriana TaxID=168575 RepID=A0AAD9TQL4_9ROSI|nr:hypothetical protein Ddye_027978 [Dipteronia dyeriana]